MDDQLRQVIRDKILESVEGTVPAFTRREARLPRAPNKAVCVIGMRRSGKTTYLHQCRSDVQQAGLTKDRAIYFSFEDERLADMEARQLSLITEGHVRLFPAAAAAPTAYFLDEIQRVPGWEMFARRMLDSGDCRLFLSGSSAKLLSREIATAMRGRGWEVPIFPFSFREFLAHHGLDRPRDVRRMTSRQAASMDHYFLRYLVEGGFPEAQSLPAPERLELLQGYVDVVLFRDVLERHGMVNLTALRQLVRRLLGSPAGLFSVQKFYADLKSQHVAVARETLHELVAHLEDAFLLQTIPVATDSEKRRNVNPRKCYPIDPALIAAFDRSGRANTGHALETVVLVELLRRKAEVAYVKTAGGHEVDFLARTLGGEAQLIQVCAEFAEPGTLEREVRALLEARQDFSRARPMLLTGQSQFPLPAVPAPIAIMPVWQWILESQA